MKAFKLAAVTSLTAFLIACGSSDSDDESQDVGGGAPGSGADGSQPIGVVLNSPFELEGLDPFSAYGNGDMETVTLEGRVDLHGALAGIEVCVDTTLDGICDSNVVLTDSSGNYTISFESPYQVPEYTVLAFVNNKYEIDAPANVLDVLSDDQYFRLASRGYNRGAVNLFTTLEVMHANPKLSYFEQNDLFGWARRTISDAYQVDAGTHFSEFQEGFESNYTREQQYSLHDQVFSAFGVALDTIGSVPAALSIAVDRPAPEVVPAIASWRGLVDVENLITPAQSALLDRAYLDGERFSMLQFSGDFTELYNAFDLEVMYAEYDPLRDEFEVTSMDTNGEYLTIDGPQQCWSNSAQEWRFESGVLSEQSATKLSSEEYQLVGDAGRTHNVTVRTINPDNEVFALSSGIWSKALDFTNATIDGQLLNVRYEVGESLCYTSQLTGRVPRESAAFSKLTERGIAEIIFPGQGAKVDASAQLVIHQGIERVYGYRIASLDDRELLFFFPVSAPASHSDTLVLEWKDEEYRNAYWVPSYRLNQFLSGISVVVLDQIGTGDIKLQLEDL